MQSQTWFRLFLLFKDITVLVVCLCFFLLRPTTKPCHLDVTMHAPFFCQGGEVKLSERECPTFDEKRGEGKGETDHRPLECVRKV